VKTRYVLAGAGVGALTTFGLASFAVLPGWAAVSFGVVVGLAVMLWAGVSGE
jgi:hypothetical protein